VLVLDEGAVRKCLEMGALIPAVERALRALSAGEVAQPVRVMVPVAGQGGFLGSMPAYTGGQLGAKLVTFFPNNKGIPTHHALVVLFKPETGEPLAVMDGRLITEMRTAAVSAAATNALARRDCTVLAILGSGVQAHSHLEALRRVRDFREVRVWSPRSARKFADQFGVRLARSAEDAVRGADVVLVATTSRTPVLQGEWLSPGMHVNAVGAPRPDWRELDDEVLRKAKLYVEQREAACRESGDVIAAGKIFAEIGEVFGGRKPGRESAEEITLFKSVGVAVEDLAAAELVYRNSLAARR
jgi:ornithine cyclodeaminase/alanine dehydrogenase-like protein (mu-crystallin family)